MTDGSPPDDEIADPAQRRAAELMLTLGREAPASSSALTHRVVRQARFQQAIAAPLRAFGAFAAALSEGLRLAVSGGRRRR
jgi:hypothetical protein